MKYSRISKKALLLSQATFLILWIIAFALANIVLAPRTWLWHTITVGLRILLIVVPLIYIPLIYLSTKYMITKDQVIYKRGIFINKKSIIEIENIIIVSVVKNPFTYIFKISSININTTGGNLLINFLELDTAKQIADFLIEKTNNKGEK